jgi:DNA adenine methylase
MATYPGGKSGSGVYQKIINQIPPHRVFVSAFLGWCGVMRHKIPAQVNIGIDVDPNVVAMWAAAVDAEKCGASGEIPGAVVENCDAISFLKDYTWQGDEFVYCDPPYLRDVRSCKRPLYDYEFWSMEQHEELLKLLKSLPCNVAISGYMSPLYSATLANWRTINYRTRTRGGTIATEWLWMNYPVPMELHDYRYLGDNHRERERLNRIKKNMSAKLARMDTLERYAVLSSIAEFRGTALTAGSA